MRGRRFQAELLTGHKGAAILVPFDPEEAWGVAPTPVASPIYGVRPGYLVEGSLNGHRFQGWIGHRWKRFFLLVDAGLQDAAGVSVGDRIDVAVRPRTARAPRRPAKKKAARR